MKVLVIGFTHLGMVYSACFTSKGVEVSLARSELHDESVYDYQHLKAEPNLYDIIEESERKGKFSFVRLSHLVLSDYDLIFIAEDTSLDSQGNPLHQRIIEIIEYVDEKNLSEVPVVLMSQVFPGFCAMSKIKSPLIYWVETLVFGKAIDRATNPEQIVLGFRFTDMKIPDALSSLLELFSRPIIRMSWESAELTKISFNFMLSMSVLGSNFLASVAEEVGANWSEIKNALRLDARIGKSAYLDPGLGITGGNLPRDLATLRSIAIKMSRTNQKFLNSIMNFNENQILWLIECIEYLENIHLFAKKSNSIGLLGLSYKVGTSSTLNSPSIRLAQIYSKNHFLAFDPVVKYVSNVNNIEICPSITNLFERSQTLILITPWPEILDALQSPTHSFKNQNIIDAGSWLDSEILMRFNNHRQRGRGSNA